MMLTVTTKSYRSPSSASFKTLVDILRRIVQRREWLYETFEPLVARLDRLSKDSWNSRYTHAGTHSPASIDKIRVGLIAEVKAIWHDFFGTLTPHQKKKLIQCMRPMSRVSERYSTRGCFDIPRTSSLVPSRDPSNISFSADDFWPPAIAAAGSYCALLDYNRVLTDVLAPLTAGPSKTTRFDIRFDNAIKLFVGFCSLTSEFVDNLRRALDGYGYRSAAPNFTQSSTWVHELQIDFELLYYGATPDYKGHDNSGWRPNDLHSILLLRPWLEAILFLDTFLMERDIPNATKRWVEQTSQSDKVRIRLKFYLDHGLLTNTQYQVADTIYSKASGTTHAMKTRFMTDAWIIRQYLPVLEAALIETLRSYKVPTT